jgi:hypothetical protein
LFVFGTTWAQPPKPSWKVKNRLQLGYEFDDNIREIPSNSPNPIEDSSLRVLFNSRAVRSAAKSNLVFGYRGGLQTYADSEFENKLINELSVSAGLRVGKTVVGLRGFGRLKNYLNDQLDYATGWVESYVLLPLIPGWGNELAVTAGGINYQNFSTFDYSQNQLKWLISKRLSRRVSASIQLTGQQIRYDRMVVEVPNDTTTVFLDKSQKDHNYGIRFQLNFSKSYMVNLSYAFQRNTSNSAGYGFNKHQVIIIWGFPLSNGLWLRGYGALQLKSYAENLALLFPIEVDSEREESNIITLDLSKDLSQEVTVLLRFASYNNESVIRNVFYRKNTFTLALDFRF